MDDNAESKLCGEDETDRLMSEAAQRITELDAERDDYRNRWLRAEAECVELRRQLHELKSVK